MIEKKHCVVFGAGALGLGFLGPELAQDCNISFVDVPAKTDALELLRREGAYVFNQTGLSVCQVRVSGVSGLCIGPDDAAIDGALDSADFVITAVGAPNLPKLAPLLAAAAGRRGAGRPLHVLCSENGVEVAEGLRSAVLAQKPAASEDAFIAGDTVMGRMCKADPEPADLMEPLGPGVDWAIVAEPFYGIPVEQHALAGMADVPEALDPQAPARFAASEDVKMLAHNALHALLAAVGYLEGAEFFDELRDDAGLMALARRALTVEAAPALLAKHGGALGRNEFYNYCDSILRRVTCPVLHDAVRRGVRGIMRKLEPHERLVYSLRTVAGQGIAPEAYATGLAAAVHIAVDEGETDLDFRGVLAEHCGFDPAADGELIELIHSHRIV